MVGCFTNLRILGCSAGGRCATTSPRPRRFGSGSRVGVHGGSMPRVGEAPRDRRDSIGACSRDDRTGPRPFTWASCPTVKLPDAWSTLLPVPRMRGFEFQTCWRLDARLAQ